MSGCNILEFERREIASSWKKGKFVEAHRLGRELAEEEPSLENIKLFSGINDKLSSHYFTKAQDHLAKRNIYRANDYLLACLQLSPHHFEAILLQDRIRAELHARDNWRSRFIQSINSNSPLDSLRLLRLPDRSMLFPRSYYGILARVLENTKLKFESKLQALHSLKRKNELEKELFQLQFFLQENQQLIAVSGVDFNSLIRRWDQNLEELKLLQLHLKKCASGNEEILSQLCEKEIQKALLIRPDSPVLLEKYFILKERLKSIESLPSHKTARASDIVQHDLRITGESENPNSIFDPYLLSELESPGGLGNTMEAQKILNEGLAGCSLLYLVSALRSEPKSESLLAFISKLRTYLKSKPLIVVNESVAQQDMDCIWQPIVQIQVGEQEYVVERATRLRKSAEVKFFAGLEQRLNPQFVLEEERLEKLSNKCSELHEKLEASLPAHRLMAKRQYELCKRALERTRKRREAYPQYERRFALLEKNQYVESAELSASMKQRVSWLNSKGVFQSKILDSKFHMVLNKQSQKYSEISEANLKESDLTIQFIANGSVHKRLEAECKEGLVQLMQELELNARVRLLEQAEELFRLGRLSMAMDLSMRVILTAKSNEDGLRLSALEMLADLGWKPEVLRAF